MSLYTSLRVSPRKKRVCSGSDEESTPKRLKIAPPTPPRSTKKPSRSLPTHLSRLEILHSALQHALSHALATCAIAPSEQTGIIHSVLNHISIATYSGFTTKFDEDDLRRLCWIWEWDPAVVPPSVTASAKATSDDDPNPFLVPAVPLPSKDWTRGSMGFIISPTSHYSKSVGKRVPVYGIGIEIEIDIDKGMTSGMAAVARWTANADKRRAEFRSKLESWVNYHPDPTRIPNVPLADLPQLAVHTSQLSSLTRALASASPKGAAILDNTIPSGCSSSSKSPSKSNEPHEFLVPFPMAKACSSKSSPSKSSTLLPQTPSSRLKRVDPLAGLLTPKTPARKRFDDSLPTTPVHQRGSGAQTAPSTPNTSRRQAIYDRVRLKSLTSTPVKAKSAEVAGGKLTKEQIQKLSQEEIRRRCLLGRLGSVAECIWMLFSSPVGSTATPTTRKRKALLATDVTAAVVKSSPIPISTLEASDSLKLLTALCPFFLKPLNLNGEEWFEMPPTALTLDATENSPKKSHVLDSPTKPSKCNLALSQSPGSRVFGSDAPTIPSSKARLGDAGHLLTQSSRRIERELEVGGIRKVKEIVRRELELHD